MSDAKTVLLVEDDMDLLAYAQEVLGLLGYKVLSAENAEAALTFIQGSVPVDLLFSDIRLPGGMDGVSLAGRIAQLRPDIKILLVSGYDSSFVKGTTQGKFPFMQKPYYLEDLDKAIRSLIGTPNNESLKSVTLNGAN